MATKQHWLISYVWRRRGREERSPDNEATDLSPGTWLRQTMEANANEEYVLVSATPISAAEFEWFRDHL